MMERLGFLPRQPVLLSPMAGFTDLAYRALCKSLGCDFTYTEMISAKGLSFGGEGSRRLLRSSPLERPCGVQLFGREPELMAAMVRRIAEEYQGEVALIDINMGCPAPKITGNGEGSALMKEPLLAGRLIEAAAKASALPVSVKLRKGWDGGSVNCLELIRIARESGAAMATLHGRTREQMYSGAADWDIIAEAVAATDMPIIGNGDITGGADALRMLAHTRCHGVMIGRGALGNPFIFNEVKAALAGEEYTPPTDARRLDMALRHLDAVLADKGEHGAVEMRKHIAYYVRGMKGAAAFRAEATRAEDSSRLRALIEEYRAGLQEQM